MPVADVCVTVSQSESRVSVTVSVSVQWSSLILLYVPVGIWATQPEASGWRLRLGGAATTYIRLPLLLIFGKPLDSSVVDGCS